MADFIYAGDAGAFKVCSKCDEIKSLSGFFGQSNCAFGVRPSCKACDSSRNAIWRSENKEECASYKDSYRELNIESIRERDRVRSAKTRASDPNAIRSKLSDWHAANPEKNKEYQSRYYLNNSHAVSKRNKEWRAANPENVRALAKKAKVKRRSNPKTLLEDVIRRGVWSAIARGSKRGRKTFDLLGYTADELRAHIDSQFVDGMSWDNYGDWHIDHVLPLASFVYATPDCPDFKRAWSLTNLQPLWAFDNMSKGARLDHPTQAALLSAA